MNAEGVSPLEYQDDADFPGHAELATGGTEWRICKNCGDTIVPCPVYKWTHDEVWNTGPDCQMSAEPASQEGRA